MKKLLIFGLGETAAIAAEYFSFDSKEIIHGFVVDDEYYVEGSTFYGLPVYPFKRVLHDLPRDAFKIFVALSYGKLNRQRLRVFDLFAAAGFDFASYVSTRSTLWRTASIGRNCMIFEGNNIQHRSVIEDNVILWSGNHIGHGSRIGHSTYVSSHVCIAGESRIGDRCFLGINSSIIDNISVGDDCFITAGSLINKNAEPLGIYSGNPATRNERVSSLKYFKVSK